MNTRTWSAAAGSREFRSWHHLPRIPGSDPSHLDLGFSSQDSLAWWGKAHPLCLPAQPSSACRTCNDAHNRLSCPPGRH